MEGRNFPQISTTSPSTMNGRNGPLSPVSAGGSEWSGISRYQTPDTDSPYSPSLNNRGQLASPPVSSGSNGTINGGVLPPRGSSAGGGGAPSPPASIARSSVSSKKDEQFEASLSEHYVALRRYLAAYLRDEKGNPRPNRARDKLLRLSPVQFQELSTDVFDELLRRQQSGRRTPNGTTPDGGPPPYLLPKDTFHPKRNQARQKLSTLPSPRFRDLATDVFYELERRFPRFAGDSLNRVDSPASMRGPPSRNGTPVNGSMNGSRGPNRMRRPSDASSIAAYSVRSESRSGLRPSIGGGIPQSPGLPPNDFGRPTPKTFQSNTIVPNKSTMVEDDETGGEDNGEDEPDMLSTGKRESEKSNGGSEIDKKLIDDYQSQIAELREKLDAMEDTIKQKDDELNVSRENERSRSSAANLEQNEWSNMRMDLESKLADVQNLNESLQAELERARASQETSEKELRSQVEKARADVEGSRSMTSGNSDLERENDELRVELEEQQHITDEVRREAQEFLREMRILSERSSSSFDREEQLSNTVNKLEEEVRDWRNRYARTKTQLRSLRASSIGLTIQPEAAKYLKDSGFTQEDGLVLDVHVTKFQISIDELLRIARADDPQRVTDYMKSVVVAVRRITQDIDEAPSNNGDLAQIQVKLKSRVSATANNLITASKNYAAAKGLSPVSLLDAAASHLTTAVVELVRTVKIRPTPAGELEDDDDGNLSPIDTTGFFPVQLRQDNLPPPFQGLRTDRVSADSSMYSPINSPRESTIVRPTSANQDSWAERQRSLSKSTPSGLNIAKSLPPNPMGMGFGIRVQDNDVEELKIYLEDQTALLVQNIQSLVSSIRSDSGFSAISTQIDSIAGVVGKVVLSTETAIASNGSLTQAQPILRKLSSCRHRLVEAGDNGRIIADDEQDDEEGDRIWRQWTQSLPPIAFEIARETKELVLRIDILDGNSGAEDEDFS